MYSNANSALTIRQLYSNIHKAFFFLLSRLSRTPVVGHVKQVYPVCYPSRPSHHEVASGHDFGQERTEAHDTAT